MLKKKSKLDPDDTKNVFIIPLCIHRYAMIPQESATAAGRSPFGDGVPCEAAIFFLSIICIHIFICGEKYTFLNQYFVF